jgi:uncharacterized membrane protein
MSTALITRLELPALATRTRSATHALYLCAIALKGLDGLVETVLGLLIAVTGPDKLYELALRFTTPELLEEGSHRFAEAVERGEAALAHVSGVFAVLYLLAHGVLKLAIAINLLRGKRWIYLPACLVLAGFVLFLGYRAASHRSWLTGGLALFDLLTLALVLNEWRQSRGKRGAAR